MTTRIARVSDVPQLVMLHRTSGVNGILTFLTNAQLSNFFYLPVVTDDNFRTTVVVTPSDTVVGVISISEMRSEALQSSLLQRLGLVARVAAQAIIHPSLFRLIYNYLRMQRFIHTFISRVNSEYKEIQLLLIDHKVQSRGIGAKLISSIDSAEENYIVQTQNSRAVGFYSRHGFQVVKCFGVGSHKLWLMSRVATDEL